MTKANSPDLAKPCNFLALILVFTLSLLPIATYAQANGLSSDISSLSVIGQMFSRVFGTSFLDQFINQGLALSQRLTAGAQALAGGISLASIVWGLLMAMAKNESPFDVVLEHCIFVALIVMLIQSYAVLVRQVIDIALWVLSAVTGGDIGAAVDGFLRAFWQAIFASFGQFTTAIFQAGSGGGVAAAILALGASIGGLLFLGIALVFALWSIKDLIGVILLGPVFLAVGIVLGPLFVATLASSWTRRWFDQWFNFLVSSAFLIAVTGIVLTILGAVITGIFDNFTGSSYGVIIGVTVLASSFGLVFQQIPAMVDAIFPGRTGAGAAGKVAGHIGNEAKTAASGIKAAQPTPAKPNPMNASL